MSNKTASQSNQEIVAIPYKVIQGLLSKQVSGQLIIEDPNDISVNWSIYLRKGKIDFATSLSGKRERAIYLCSQVIPNHDIDIPSKLEDDYQFICQLAKNSSIVKNKLKYILFAMTQEAILSCLALPRAKIKFNQKILLEPIIINFNIKQLVQPIKQQISFWVQIRQQVTSSFIRPIIKNWPAIETELNRQTSALSTLESLKSHFNEQYTIYEIAGYSNLSTLNVAQLLAPLIEKKLIAIKPFHANPTRKKYVVACIDDSKAIQRVVKMTLMAGGFEVIGITEPAKAISSFVRKKPDLILMDINMPGIDGYKLSYMVRKSDLLKDIPILMLTGRDGALDRVKAKVVGANGYISKPFDPQELVQSIQDHIQL